MPRPEGPKTFAATLLGEQKEGLWMVVGIILMLILGRAAYAGYEWLDDQGWVTHSSDTPVWIEGEWLGGEYRMCQMPGTAWGELPANAHLLCGKGLQNAADGIWPAGFRDRLSIQEFNSVFGGGHWDLVEHYFHVLPVHYWGKIDRLDRMTFSWSCQRQENGLECKALN
jgi:hypothetical protein